MKIIFIRHGEPDYTHVTERGFIGHGLDLGSLTEEGKRQAFTAAMDKRLDGIELIVSSPYTRALQTAAIISRNRNTDINVELDLHEWLPDLTYTYNSETTVLDVSRIITENKGKCPVDAPMQYESLESVFTRANNCLKKYLCYNKIAVVAHAIVIRQFGYNQRIPYCGIHEVDYDDNYKWCGWIE